MRSTAAIAFAGAALLSGALLASGGRVDAAMVVRISVDPSPPIVGEPARVTVVTLAPFSQHCVDDPDADMRPWSDWHPSPVRLDLRASGAGQSLDVALVQRGADPAYWDGELNFPAAGTWTLRMVYPQWGGGSASEERCAGARVTVEVSDPAYAAAPATAAETVFVAGAIVLLSP